MKLTLRHLQAGLELLVTAMCWGFVAAMFFGALVMAIMSAMGWRP